GTLSPVVSHGVGGWLGVPFDRFRPAVSHLPNTHGCYQETQAGRNCLEIGLEMFLRYVIVPFPQSSSMDVERHVSADVCFHPRNRLQSCLNRPSNSSKFPDSTSHIPHRSRFFPLAPSRPVNTSNRIPLLSP